MPHLAVRLGEARLAPTETATGDAVPAGIDGRSRSLLRRRSRC